MLPSPTWQQLRPASRGCLEPLVTSMLKWIYLSADIIFQVISLSSNCLIAAMERMVLTDARAPGATPMSRLWLTQKWNSLLKYLFTFLLTTFLPQLGNISLQKHCPDLS